MGQTKTIWVFKKQRQRCYEQAYAIKEGYWYDTGRTWLTGRKRWKAKFWEGGNRDFANGLWWHCDPAYRTVIDHEVGVEQGKTAMHGGGFNLAGFSADVTQTTATNVTWSMGPGGRFSRARVCGRGNYLMKAAQVREVAW